jgi:hypothetical protein
MEASRQVTWGLVREVMEFLLKIKERSYKKTLWGQVGA